MYTILHGFVEFVSENLFLPLALLISVSVDLTLSISRSIYIPLKLLWDGSYSGLLMKHLLKSSISSSPSSISLSGHKYIAVSQEGASSIGSVGACIRISRPWRLCQHNF